MSRMRQRQLTVVVLCVIVAVVASNAFDRLLWHVVAPAVIVGLVAVLTSRLSGGWRAVGHALTVVGGVALAVFVEVGSVRDVVDSFVAGPRRLLTTEWPSPAVPTTVGAVALLVGVTTAGAADLAGRRRFHLMPLAVVAAGWAAALAIGAPQRPTLVWLVATVAVAVWFALLRPSSEPVGVVSTVASDRTIAASLVALAVVVVASSSAVAWSNRADPRRTQDAEFNSAVLDPIEEMIALRRADPEVPLYQITDRSRLVGDSLPARWRLAALDTYDGQRWVPTVTLRPIGGRLDTSNDVSLEGTPPVSYSLEFLSDDFDLLPVPGSPISVNTEVRTDIDRVVVQLAERPSIGDQLSVQSQVALTSRSALAGSVGLRQVDEIAEGFSEQAARLSGDGTVQERVRRLEQRLKTDWSLDSAAPGSGQQLALIERFVTDTQRGTEEQFVTGFVLLARSLGVNARVATGFVVPPGSIRSPLRVDSSMATVWPEVEFDDVGWVAFDPVPDVEETDDEEPPTPPEAQTPAAVQPPIAPPSDDVDEVDEASIDTNRGETRWAVARRWAARVATVSGLTLLPFALAIAALLGVKWWRRRKRVVGVPPAAKVHGVWANTTDALVDAGLLIGPSWTDDHIAVQGAGVAPTVPHELRRLAAMATHVTFGTPASAANLAADATATAAAIDGAIRAHRTRWERVRWRLSLRSLRPSTRSPVADH